MKARLLVTTHAALFAFSGVAAANTIFVTKALSNKVAVINEATHETIKEITVGSMPHEVVVTPNGKTALVSNFGDLANFKPGSTLSVIDVASGSVTKTIILDNKSRPHGLQFLSDTQALVTAQGIQSLLLVDITTGQVVKRVSLPGAGSHMVTVDAEQRYAYITNQDSGSLVKVDLKTFTVAGEVQVGKIIEGVALSPDESMLLVTARKDNYVSAIRTKDLTVLKNIKTGYGPVRVVFFNNGKSAVVANSISGNAQIIDVANLEITKSFKTTTSYNPVPAPTNIYIRKDQVTAYIANSFACNVTLVDLVEGKVLDTMKVSYMPDGLAVSSTDLQMRR